jgi:hypothetical protein
MYLNGHGLDWAVCSWPGLGTVLNTDWPEHDLLWACPGLVMACPGLGLASVGKGWAWGCTVYGLA